MTTTRSIKDIDQEYGNRCAELGHAIFEIQTLNLRIAELEAFKDRIPPLLQALNVEKGHALEALKAQTPVAP